MYFVCEYTHACWNMHETHTHTHHTETRIFNLFICVHGNSSQIKCMETVKCLDVRMNELNETIADTKTAAATATATQLLSRLSVNGITFIQMLFSSKLLEKIKAECRVPWLAVLASSMQTLKSAGSIVVQQCTWSTPLPFNMRFTHVRQKTQKKSI